MIAFVAIAEEPINISKSSIGLPWDCRRRFCFAYSRMASPVGTTSISATNDSMIFTFRAFLPSSRMPQSNSPIVASAIQQFSQPTSVSLLTTSGLFYKKCMQIQVSSKYFLFIIARNPLLALKSANHILLILFRQMCGRPSMPRHICQP